MKICRHATGKSFLARAGRWLLEQEAEHNLILGIAHQLLSGKHPYSPPIYLATVESGGEVLGCAWRTPPHKVGLTRMPEEALPMLADDLAELYDAIPAVLGGEAEARALARIWAGRRNVAFLEGRRQRIYQLRTVTHNPDGAGGRLRPARPEDERRVAGWLAAFAAELGERPGTPVDTARYLIEQKRIYLWGETEPLCMAGTGGETPTGVRIGYVYTPPELRRRGYATRSVAQLSQQMLDRGKSLCFLYTDLENPVSNSIYRKIGYEPVCDVVDYCFPASSEC